MSPIASYKDLCIDAVDTLTVGRFFPVNSVGSPGGVPSPSILLGTGKTFFFCAAPSDQGK